MAGETVYFMWNSADSNGASITRSTNGTISVYKDANTTQTVTGVTDTEDFDALTGVHHVAIATSDAFYTAATDYMVVLSAATIDTRTVNAVLAHFSIENRAGGGADASITAAKIATDAIGAAEIADGAITAATFAAGAIDATAIANGAIDAATFAAGAIDAAAIANGAIDAATFAAGAIDAAAIATDAIGAAELADGAITAATFAAGAIDATAIANGAIDAATFAAGAIDAAAIAADAIGASELAADAVTEIQSGLSTVTTAQVNAEVVDALATDTYAEPGQGSPAATASLATKIGFLHKAWRNRHTQTATEYALFADDAVTKDQEAPVSDDATTFERGEVVTGL